MFEWSHIPHFVTTQLAPYWNETTLLAALIVLGALICGTFIKHRIRRANHASAKTQFVQFITPLIPPTLSTLLVALVYHLLQEDGAGARIYLFFLKLSIAWLAIRFVMLMTSRRSAGWFILIVIAPITLLQLFELWSPVAHGLRGITLAFGTFELSAYHMLKGILALIILFWLAGMVNNLINRRIYQMQFVHYSHRTLMAKIFQIFLYFVVFVVAMQMVGIDLTALSVLGGAIGVGIGFGLQKIASNFISGIILLVERSIQVDDLVEMSDGTFGYVRRTGARYTLLETFDGKEVLIPNEEFITQRMVSWTHSNTFARVELSVGVKYGTDLEQALAILKEAATEHPRCVLDDDQHPPFVFVSEFGDSAITLNLFFWVTDVNEGRLQPKSDVIIAIDKKFKQAGIEIPFPQRVVHMAAPSQANDQADR
jgi:small-conductance mechanosensitive channel